MIGLIATAILVGFNCGMGFMQYLYNKNYKITFQAATIIFLLLVIQLTIYYIK